MTELVEIVKDIEERVEESCKNTHEMKNFFQKLIWDGELKAYNFEINKEVIEIDTEDEKVVKTIKGTTLSLIDDIHPNSATGCYFFEDPLTGIKYSVHFDFSSSNSDFEPLEHRRGSCDIAKLIENPDFRKIEGYFDRIDIPKYMIAGGLHYSWTDDIWNEHNILEKTHHEKSGYLRIKGKQDKLFGKVCEFVRSK